MKALDDLATLTDLVHPDFADIIILRKVLVFLKLSDWIGPEIQPHPRHQSQVDL
jgi:hypothetical protein